MKIWQMNFYDKKYLLTGVLGVTPNKVHFVKQNAYLAI